MLLTATPVHTLSGLERLSAEWRELFSRIECPVPFLSIEWMGAWWRQCGGFDRLCVVAVREPQGSLVAVAPFYLRVSRLQNRGARVLSLLGNGSMGSEYLNLLVDPWYSRPAIDAITYWVMEQRGEWDYVEFVKGDQDSPIFRTLCERFKSCGMSSCEVWSGVSPYIRLPRSFEEYLSGVSSNLRYNFRRRRKALEREGKIELHVVQDWPTIQASYGELLRLHRQRFRQKDEMSDFLDPVAQRFHIEALHRMSAGGMARLFVLRVGGKAIAALYGFSAGKRFSFYQSGMDPDWSRLSVGLVLMGYSIEEAIRSGHDEFDFLEGDQPYKYQWATKTRPLVTRCFFDSRIRSRFAWSRVWTVRELKKIKAWFR